MYVPDEMNPHVLCKDWVHSEGECPTCEQDFILGDGIMYEMYYHDLDEEKVEFGHVAFCSYVCLLAADMPMANS